MQTAEVARSGKWRPISLIQLNEKMRTMSEIMTIETGNCAFVRGKINRLCFWDWLNSSNPRMLESTLRRYNILTVKILLACFPPALIVKNRIALINHSTLFLIQPPLSPVSKTRSKMAAVASFLLFLSDLFSRHTV